MTFEQVKQNIQYGDYNTLQKVLGLKTVPAARARFLRQDPEAVKAMKAIQDKRDQLVKEFQTQNQ